MFALTIACVYAVALLVIAFAWAVASGPGLPNAWTIKNRVLRTAYGWATFLVFTPLFLVVAIIAIVWFSLVAALREAWDSIVDLSSGWGDLGRLLLGREAR